MTAIQPAFFAGRATPVASRRVMTTRADGLTCAGVLAVRALLNTGASGRPRVLWLVKGLDLGGTERLLLTHAALRDRSAFDCSLAYVLPRHAAMLDRFADADVPVTCLAARSELDLRWTVGLKRLLRSVDVLHVHSPYAAGLARLVAGTVPVVYTEHSRWPQYHRATWALNVVTYPLNAAVVAVSHDVRRTVPRALRSRVQVVHHGVDRAVVRPDSVMRAQVRRELGVGPDEVLFGTVANLRTVKNYQLLQAAAQIVAARLPQARFVAIGDGPLRAEVAARHAASGLGDRFSLLGAQPDAARLMQAFDVLCLASRHEGLPVTIMEALALGLPVVSTAVGGVPEAVRDGVEGRLVALDDEQGFARALAELVEQPDLRVRMARAALDRSALFDAASSVRQVEDVYRSVLR